MPLKITTRVNEGSSCKLEFTLTDYNGNGVSSANMSAATYTLKDTRTGDVINSRTDVNVLSYFDTSGNFSYILTASDNIIYNANRKKHKKDYESHLFVVDVTAEVNGEVVSLQESIEILVSEIY